MDHNTLFPVLEMGFSFWDILMKPEICAGCSYWQVIFSTAFPCTSLLDYYNVALLSNFLTKMPKSNSDIVQFVIKHLVLIGNETLNLISFEIFLSGI